MKRKTINIFALCASIVFAGTLFAGGAFISDSNGSGVPARWPYNSNTKKWEVRYIVDKGVLTAGIENQEAINNWVLPILNSWKNLTIPNGEGDLIPSTAIDFIDEGLTADDITKDNYTDYLQLDLAQAGPAVIVFDPDGSLIKQFFLDRGDSEESATAKQNGIAGIGAPLTLSANDRAIYNGYIILNGRLIDGISNNGNNEMPANQFKGVVLHEMGHLLNLDHAQVNLNMAEKCNPAAFGACEGGTEITTMFPASLTAEQSMLHRDDKIMAAYLYPSQAYKDNFCTFAGEIVDKDGKGMQGINVIARNVSDPYKDARAMVSGVFYPPGTANGQYFLGGLAVGKDYRVEYETLTPTYSQREGSTFKPLDTDTPTDIGNGFIGGPDGTGVVRCESGGQVIRFSDFQLNVAAAGQGAGEGTGGEEKKKKGWFCQLHVGPSDPAFAFGFAGFVILTLALFIACRYKCGHDR